MKVEDDLRPEILESISNDIASLAHKLGAFTNIYTQVCSILESVELSMTLHQLEDACAHLKTLLSRETTSSEVNTIFPPLHPRVCLCLNIVIDAPN